MAPVALVTGSTRGIGLAIASALYDGGFNVALNGVRDEAHVQDVLALFPPAAVEAIYCQGDVASAVDRDTVVSRVRSRFGRLNILVNNAGVAPRERQDPLDASEESFERVMRINLQGPYFLTQAVARWMVEQKRNDAGFSGAIVNIGSISATVVSPNRGEYCMSKAAFAMHSKIWAVRMAEVDIPVYEVRPGIVRTDMTASVRDKYDRLIDQGLTVQRRWGTPEDVSRAVLSLVLGNFPYSTGEVISVDGGLTLQRL